MPDEPLVDTHAHFWDQSLDHLEWAWLKPGFTFRRWKTSDDFASQTYLPPDLLAEAEGTGLAQVVHVHAADPIEDPAVETTWLESVAQKFGTPHAIVGRGELTRPDAVDVLRRHAAHPRFRGVRDITAHEDFRVDDAVGAMDVARELGISIELRRHHDDFGALAEVAHRWPDITITLSHGCFPLERSSADLASWSAAMRNLARTPNIYCKISAVAGASDPDWTPASIRPWILSAVDAFGADRCMLGSNWPVDRLFGTYKQLIDAYREVTAELDPVERNALFHGTANRVYDLPAIDGA